MHIPPNGPNKPGFEYNPFIPLQIVYNLDPANSPRHLEKHSQVSKIWQSKTLPHKNTEPHYISLSRLNPPPWHPIFSSFSFHSANTTQLSSWKYSIREWRALSSGVRNTQNQIPLDSAIEACFGIPIISNNLFSVFSRVIQASLAEVGLDTYDAGT